MGETKNSGRFEKQYSGRRCVVCRALFAPRSPNQIYCPECLSNGKARSYYRRRFSLGRCCHCGRKTASFLRWCKDPRCQKAKTEYLRLRSLKNRARNLKNARDAQKMYRGVHDFTRKTQSERHHLCQRCGQDAYPNRFYCPRCHALVSRSAGGLEEMSVFAPRETRE